MVQIQIFKCEACGEEFEQDMENFSFGGMIQCEDCYKEYISGLFEEYD